jgi:hypothetical protein
VRSVEEILEAIRVFESQFSPGTPPPPGTFDRKRIWIAMQRAARDRACLPENIKVRLALCEELKKAQRSATARAAAAKRQRDPQHALRQWVYNHLLKMGFRRETKTSSGSVYYRLGGHTVRISDHEVPLTSQREDSLASGAHSWADSRWSLELTTCFAAARWLVDVRRNVLAGGWMQ